MLCCAYQGSDREVIIGGEVLDNDNLAVDAKEYEDCTYGDEESQHAGELGRTVFARHGWRWWRVFDAFRSKCGRHLALGRGKGKQQAMYGNILLSVRL
jgi:hypothetical protein